MSKQIFTYSKSGRLAACLIKGSVIGSAFWLSSCGGEKNPVVKGFCETETDHEAKVTKEIEDKNKEIEEKDKQIEELERKAKDFDALKESLKNLNPSADSKINHKTLATSLEKFKETGVLNASDFTKGVDESLNIKPGAPAESELEKALINFTPGNNDFINVSKHSVDSLVKKINDYISSPTEKDAKSIVTCIKGLKGLENTTPSSSIKFEQTEVDTLKGILTADVSKIDSSLNLNQLKTTLDNLSGDKSKENIIAIYTELIKEVDRLLNNAANTISSKSQAPTKPNNPPASGAVKITNELITEVKALINNTSDVVLKNISNTPDEFSKQKIDENINSKLQVGTEITQESLKTILIELCGKVECLRSAAASYITNIDKNLNSLKSEKESVWLEAIKSLLFIAGTHQNDGKLSPDQLSSVSDAFKNLQFTTEQTFKVLRDIDASFDIINPNIDTTQAFTKAIKGDSISNHLSDQRYAVLGKGENAGLYVVTDEIRFEDDTNVNQKKSGKIKKITTFNDFSWQNNSIEANLNGNKIDVTVS